MFRSRWRKIWRDVRARKGRTLLVSMAIFIGVAGTIALFSLNEILIGQLQEDIKPDELAMLRIAVMANAGMELDNDDYLTRLREVPTVTDVMGGVQAATVYFKTDSSAGHFLEGTLNAYSAPYDEMTIEPVRLLHGRYPVSGAHEIAVEQRMAAAYGLHVDDTLYLRMVGEHSAADVIVEPWTVTGVFFHPYSESPDNSLYASLEDAGLISGQNGYNQFWARFATFPDAEQHTEVFSSVIADHTPYHPLFTESEDPVDNSDIKQARMIGSTMSFLALVALLVSGFLVINVTSTIIVEQKKQIGIMQSLGATRRDNFLIYCGIAFTYGLIGVIPGLIVGIPLGYGLAHALAPQLNTIVEGFRWSPSAIIIGVLTGLLIPVLASLIPVLNGTRISILDAITDLGINATYGAGPLARLIRRLPVPVSIRQALSNVTLKKSRLAFTVLALTIAVGSFMGVCAVFDTLTTGLDTFFNTFNIEIGVFPSEGRNPQEIVSILQENFQTEDRPLIDTIEPGFQLQVEFEGYEPAISVGGPPGIFVYGYDITSEKSAFDFTIDKGSGITPETSETGLILSDTLAADMGVDVGDKLTLKVPGNSAAFEVVGISQFPISQVWMDWRTLARLAGFMADVPQPNRYTTQATAGDNQALQILGADASYRSQIALVDGEYLTENGVLLNREWADAAGYQVGDTLTLTAEQTTAPYTVTGIYEGSDTPSAVMLLDDLLALEGVDPAGVPQPQAYFVTTTLDDPSITELDEIIAEMNEVLLEQGVLAFNLNFVEMTTQLGQVFLMVQILLSAVAGLIALIGALGLLTTLSMSVFERQKEIGVMRSIGASSTTIISQFLVEGFTVGFIAWLLGLPLALLIEVILLEVTGFIDTFSVTFSLSAALYGFVGMLFFALLSSLWPAVMAARKTVSEVLRYQ